MRSLRGAVLLFSFSAAAEEADQVPPRWSVDGRYFLHSTFEFTTSGYITAWLTSLQTGKTEALFTVISRRAPSSMASIRPSR